MMSLLFTVKHWFYMIFSTNENNHVRKHKKFEKMETLIFPFSSHTFASMYVVFLPSLNRVKKLLIGILLICMDFDFQQL